MTDADAERLRALPLVKDLGTRFIDDDLLFLSVRRDDVGYIGCSWSMCTRLYASAAYGTPEEAESVLLRRSNRQ